MGNRRPAVKLAGFAVVVAAAFSVGAAVGAIAGPIEVTDPVDHDVEHEGTPVTTMVESGSAAGGGALAWARAGEGQSAKQSEANHAPTSLVAPLRPDSTSAALTIAPRRR